MRLQSVSLPKEHVLKIDKDCHIDTELEQEYIRDTLAILSKRGIKVLTIEATRTYHGRHYYFHLAEPVDAQTANRLQYLLGDDPKRVDYNQARINSGLVGWNKLFETIGRKLRTIYPNASLRPHSDSAQFHSSGQNKIKTSREEEGESECQEKS